MPFNDELADRFDEMASLLEVLAENRFRVAAHAKVARILRDMTDDLKPLAEDKPALTAIEGIGDKTADKIAEYARTGHIEELDQLRAKVPAGLTEVLEVPGLGPKTVALLWNQLGVTSLEDLKRAIEDGSAATLPRMGAKSIEKIKASIRFHESSAERTPLGLALPIAEHIIESLKNADKSIQRIDYAGSLRRGAETIGDIDILAATSDPAATVDAFKNLEGVQEVIASGETKTSIRYTHDRRTLQVDLRIVPSDRYGAALLYFTGSKNHNVKLRERAIERGMTLNEYGLFKETEAQRREGSPQSRGAKPIAADTEHSVYEALQLPFIEPELREDRGELADDFEPPKLIKLEDIRAELHAHTTASDGRLSIEQLAEHAKQRGFHTIAVTDHSVSSTIAGGLDPDRLRRHIDAVRTADENTRGITILAGSEVDILSDGSLDYDDDLLAQLDIIVASPHAALTQDTATAMKRLLRAIAHPLVNILGHPTGRLINRRAGLELEIPELAAAAAQHAVALELNANWMRLDLRDTHLRIAIEKEALITIDCDVHTPDHFDHLRFGILTARRAGLEPDRCPNTWTKARLHKWLRSKR
ncbi:MAG: DNA polymerase/3'-5' exonuclease PolX [Phycisphaerales bacterium]